MLASVPSRAQRASGIWAARWALTIASSLLSTWKTRITVRAGSTFWKSATYFALTVRRTSSKSR